MYDEDDPHGSQPVLHEGASLGEAESAVVLVHGRGATAGSIMRLSDGFRHDGTAYLAPEAIDREWYPWSFTAPTEENQPKLGSALGLLDDITAELGDAGVPPDSVGIVGFSQGACLAAEYAARNPRRYGCVGVLSGGLVGNEVTVEGYAGGGSLDGTPVFLGCSDVDPHVPADRVDETERVMEALDGDVTRRVYEGMDHTVNADEVEVLADLVGRFV